jgi:hypothetical protein
MIQVTCPHCGSKLNAKDELAGQTRRCPKCRSPIIIAATPAAAPSNGEALPGDGRLGTPASSGVGTTQIAVPEGSLPSHRYLERLNRHYVYLICDRSNVVAQWENNGQGWSFRSHTGMVNAARNQQLLPSQGKFQLVEVKMSTTDEGTRLTGLTCYQLADRWALNALARGDDAIVGRIEGHVGLSREQKNAVRTALKERFMHEVWQHAQAVSEFLSSADYHSHEV